MSYPAFTPHTKSGDAVIVRYWATDSQEAGLYHDAVRGSNQNTPNEAEEALVPECVGFSEVGVT